MRIFWRRKEMAMMILALGTVCCCCFCYSAYQKCCQSWRNTNTFTIHNSQSRITRWIFVFVSPWKRRIRRYWIWYAKREKGPSYPKQIIKNQVVHIRMDTGYNENLVDGGWGFSLGKCTYILFIDPNAKQMIYEFNHRFSLILQITNT